MGDGPAGDEGSLDAGLDPESLASAALDWLLTGARESGPGLVWTGVESSEEADPSLYSGGAGIVLALLDAYQHFGDVRFADAAVRGARALAVTVEGWDHCSLYFGLAGIAFAIGTVAELLDEATLRPAIASALGRVRERFDGERWSDQFELMGGNAGIALAGMALGEIELSLLAVTPYIDRVEATPNGVQWEVLSGTPARFHHISHGTLGIVVALAAVGRAAARADLVELAIAGAADVVSRNAVGPDGFLVPHSDPQYKPELIERFSYGWCHGPAGDAQAFRWLAEVTGDPVWPALVDRCWHTVTSCGVPARLRPGFWDNSGRCCGTAGALALACDRMVEKDEGGVFADTLARDLARRATVDAAGARWSNHEHRVDPPALEPRMGWAMGNAGIVRELLRLVRIRSGRDPRYAADWPDHAAAKAKRTHGRSSGAAPARLT